MIPQTIPLSLIDEGNRGRQQYTGIEDLAQSILDNGLIQPIVLAPAGDRYTLVAGGRRRRALLHLNVTELHHGVTSEPGRYGFLLKTELEASELKNLLTEIAENLDRTDVPWQDNMNMMVRAWRLAKIDAASRGEQIIMRNFGRLLGVSYADFQAALKVHAEVTANPERFAECESIRGAYSLLLKDSANEASKILAARSLTSVPLYGTVASPNKAQPVPSSDAPVASTPSSAPAPLNLSAAFRNMNGIDFLESLPPDSIDHVITDPDYALDESVLNASLADSGLGIAQSTVEESLSDIRRLCHAAYSATRAGAFFIFFYDLDHHEKLQAYAKDAGWLVQRWPFVWHKLDYNSNASAAHNFTKNLEYAMICRKPGATLQSHQPSSIFACGSGNVTRELSHPFAKPFSLWKQLFSAVCIKGQVVCDPCFGSGSMPIAAAQFGLRPVGCEINPDHYNNGIQNLKVAYRKLLGPTTTFA